MNLIEIAEKLHPYQELLAPPPPTAPDYVKRQYERWAGDAERYLLESQPDDVCVVLRPHCTRRLRTMAAVLASLRRERDVLHR